MFKERVLIHRKLLSKEKNESLFIPSLLSQKSELGGKKITTEIPEPVKHANRIYFIFKFVRVSG